MNKTKSLATLLVQCSLVLVCTTGCSLALPSIHMHSYKTVVTEPTCTAGGYTTHTCECGDTYVTDELPVIEHTYEAVVTEPTCEAAGYTTYTCVCGDTYVADEVGALGHAYEAVVTEPTCTEKGYTTYTCHCGHSYVADEVEALGHTYDEEVIAPTCTEKGYTTYTCHCGDTYVGNEVGALGHTYDEEVTAPTCTEKGYTTYTCHCGYSYVGNEVAATGHAFDKGVCGVCGEEDPNYVPPVEAKTVDFNTIKTSAAYGDSGYTKSYTTTSGWVTKNSAIQTGGTADNNPTFKVVGPDNTHKAVCMNGKTSAPGSITSPTLTGGLTKINIDYTKMFTDTKLSATIKVTELSTGNVYTHQFGKASLPSSEKYVVYNEVWELETPVTGDYTIVITNDCPSKSTSNKDRMTILKFEYQ